MKTAQSRTLSIFGTLIIISGLIAYTTIGIKSKNQLIAGLLVGILSWIFSWLNSTGKINVWSGIALTFSSCILFGQRTIANLLALIGIIQHNMPLDSYNKCISFILFIFMTVTSVIALMLLFYSITEKE